jgi:hypothetical protein
MDKLSPFKIKGYDDTCPICYEYWAEAAPWVFPCGHMICETCYLKQRKVKRECHLCREKFNLKKQRRRRRGHRRNIDSDSGISGASWNSEVSWD